MPLEPVPEDVFRKNLVIVPPVAALAGRKALHKLNPKWVARHKAGEYKRDKKDNIIVDPAESVRTIQIECKDEADEKRLRKQGWKTHDELVSEKAFDLDLVMQD